MEYLGFCVTRTGIQPINKIEEAIVNTKPPKNTKEVRALIGIVNYYRYIWARRSHLLHPLTELTPPKAKFKWIYVVQKAFDDIKHNVNHFNLLSYLDFNKSFDIYTDSRDHQLGSVIS